MPLLLQVSNYFVFLSLFYCFSPHQVPRVGFPGPFSRCPQYTHLNLPHGKIFGRRIQWGNLGSHVAHGTALIMAVRSPTAAAMATFKPPTTKAVTRAAALVAPISYAIGPRWSFFLVIKSRVATCGMSYETFLQTLQILMGTQAPHRVLCLHNGHEPQHNPAISLLTIPSWPIDNSLSKKSSVF